MKSAARLLATLPALAVCAPASAALLLHDSFSGATGATPAGWAADNYGTPNATAIAARNNDLVAAGNLSVGGLAASTGNSWAQENSAYQYYRRDFAATPLALGETVYYSFIVQLNDISTLNSTGVTLPLLGLSSNTTTSMGNTVVSSIGFSKDTVDPTKFNITVDGDFRGPNHASSNKLSGQFSTGASILIVGSYTRTSTASPNTSSASFWINPSSASFGAVSAPTATLTDAAANNTALQSFLIASTTALAGQPNAWVIDELRIGTTWADVTPALATVPEPSAFALLGGGLALAFAASSRRRRR